MYSKRTLNIVSLAQNTEMDEDDFDSDDSIKDPDYAPSSLGTSPGYLEVLSPKPASEHSELYSQTSNRTDKSFHLNRFLNDIKNIPPVESAIEERPASSPKIHILSQVILKSTIQKDNSSMVYKENNNINKDVRDVGEDNRKEIIGRNSESNTEQNLTLNSLMHTEDADLDFGPLPFDMTKYLNSNINISKRKKRIWDKKDFCLYCFENVTNFSRHLIRKHNNEIAVQQFMEMKLGSITRKNFIDKLRKKGNFLSPAQNEIKTVRRPTQYVSPENILPCTYCQGYYMKRYLKRHVLKCPQRPENDSKQKFNVTSDAQTYLAFRSVDDKFISSLRMKDGILNMRSDSISLLAKSEPLILSFGSFYAKRHRHKHLNKVTKNKLRELARLWQNMKLYITEKSMFDVLKPENFKYFILCTRNICGFDEKTQQFKQSPSLALHMGTTLKQLCDHAFSEIQQKNMIFTKGIDSPLKANQIKILRQLIKTNWNAEISSVANQDLVENQWKKPTIIPLTSDIKKLNKFVKEMARNCAESLKENENDRKSFNNLQKCCYTLLITLNRRRIGELERLQLESYLQKKDDVISEEFLKDLTETENILLRQYKRIVIRGKRHKPVPVFFSKEVQGYIELLLSARKNFILPTNPFLFATVKKNSCLDGYSTLRTLAHQSGAEYPQALTSGKLRKHIATISQIDHLDPSEMEQLCTFLGHTVTTHQNFYRLPQEIYQTAKLAKLLLKSQGEVVDENLNEDLISDEDEDDRIDDGQNDISDEIPEVQFTDGNEQSPMNKTNKRSSKSEKLILTNKKVLKEVDNTNYSAKHHKNEEKGKVKHPKVKWTEEQKILTVRYFKGNIEKKKTPTEMEIEEFREKYDCMRNKDWKKIKAFIFNGYRKL